MRLETDPRSPFAVVVPLYNAERFIGRALASVASQTHPPREVIVVDDGSSDDGPAIVRAWNGVRLLSQSNAGAGPARRTGISTSTAPWIAFLDADDIWSPVHLAALQRIIHDVPEAGLIATRYREVDNGTVERELRPGQLPRIRPGRRIDYFRMAGRRIGVVWVSAAAVRRDAHEDVGGFADLSLPADTEFWARVALRHPVAVSRSRTVLYVRGTGGLMEQQAALPRGPVDWVPLRDSTPSIRSTVAGLDRRHDGIMLRSVELYIDGRATSTWRTVLIRADQRWARRRLVELTHPFHWSAWPFALAASVPLPLGRMLAEGWRRLKWRPGPPR